MTITLEYTKPIPGTCLDGSTGVVKRGDEIVGDFIDLGFKEPFDLFFATPDSELIEGKPRWPFVSVLCGGSTWSEPHVKGTKAEVVAAFEKFFLEDLSGSSAEWARTVEEHELRDSGSG